MKYNPKRKWISLILATLMIFSLLPTGVLADTEIKTDVVTQAMEKIIDQYRINGIAEDINAPWLMANFIAYESAYPDSIHKLSDKQKADARDEMIGKASVVTTPGDLAKYIVALRSLGYDAKKVTTASGENIDLVQKLTALVDQKAESVTNLYTLPSVITALWQHESYATAGQMEFLISAALSQVNHTDGGWGGAAWFEDSTSMMIHALSPYYDTNAQVKSAIDHGLVRLKDVQRDDGAIGDDVYGAASTGLAVAAFASVGENPGAVSKDGKSLVDGLLGYLNQDGNALLPDDNSYSTEQGFRGLLSAASAAIATGEAYMLYDFRDFPLEHALATPAKDCLVIFNVIPGDAVITVQTADGIVQMPTQAKTYDLPIDSYTYSVSKSGYVTKSGDFAVTTQDILDGGPMEINVSLTSEQAGNASISVTVYVKTHGSDCNQAYTYKKNANKFQNIIVKTVSLKPGSSVFDALDAAITAAEGTYVEDSAGYISSINGISELDHGGNAGWMYLVGSTVSQMGCRNVTLSKDTTVTWFYTDDYTSEYGSENWSGGSGTTSKEDVTVTTGIEAKEGSDGIAAATVTDKIIEEAIKSADSANAGTIVIAVSGTEDADALDTILTKKSLESLSKAGKALIFETSLGTLAVDAKAISAISSSASGDLHFFLGAAKASGLPESAQSKVENAKLYSISIVSDGKSIVDLAGGSAKISLPYVLKDGEDAKAMGVFYVDGLGLLHKLQSTYDEKAKMLTFAVTNLANPYAVMANNPLAFSDVLADAWYYDAVDFAVYNNLFNGISDLEFSPGSGMTRAMLVTVLYRLEGEPKNVSGTSFADVAEESWYAQAVAWVAENKIVEGYSSELFGTNDQVTREQLAAILYRYAHYKGMDIRGSENLDTYADIASISSWASDGMAWANAMGLITGVSARTLAPQDQSTRAQVAMIIMRLAKAS